MAEPQRLKGRHSSPMSVAPSRHQFTLRDPGASALRGVPVYFPSVTRPAHGGMVKLIDLSGFLHTEITF